MEDKVESGSGATQGTSKTTVGGVVEAQPSGFTQTAKLRENFSFTYDPSNAKQQRRDYICALRTAAVELAALNFELMELWELGADETAEELLEEDEDLGKA